MQTVLRNKNSLRSLFGIAAVLVLVGCGGDNGSSSSPAILRVLEDQMRVSFAVGTPGSQTSMMAQFVFEVRTPFSPLGGPGGAYEISPNDPSDEQLARLADSFAITAPFVSQPDELGGGLIAGPNDGTAPMLSVMNDVMNVWNYSPAWANSSIDDCFDPAASPETGTGELSQDCLETAPPQNLPSFEEAQDMFVSLMAELEVPADDLIVEVIGDQWGVTVSGFKKIDGVRSPFTWSVTYGENGSIVVAYGPLNDVVRKLGDYPRLTTDEALERLRTEQAPPGSDTSAGVGQPDSSDGPAIQLDAVEEELYILYGVDGEVYLVPGYTFIGGPENADYVQRFIVSALPDSYIEKVDLPVSSDQGSGTDDSSPGSPGDGMTDSTNDIPVDEFPAEIPLDEANALLGMTEAEATSYAESQGWTVRIASRDGEQFALTMDYMPTRVNLSIDQGLVSYVFIG
jgi:hypothetical protein